MGYNFLEYLENNQENLIKDFEDFCNENDFEIIFEWRHNLKIIDMYIKAIYYELEDNASDEDELQNCIDYIYEILDKHCCQIPF